MYSQELYVLNQRAELNSSIPASSPIIVTVASGWEWEAGATRAPSVSRFQSSRQNRYTEFESDGRVLWFEKCWDAAWANAGQTVARVVIPLPKARFYNVICFTEKPSLFSIQISFPFYAQVYQQVTWCYTLPIFLATYHDVFLIVLYLYRILLRSFPPWRSQTLSEDILLCKLWTRYSCVFVLRQT